MERGLDTFFGQWNGRWWRWWALILGIALIPITGLVAFVIAELTGNELIPLILLFLIVEILIISVLGSGFLGSLTGRMTRGGLTRESSDYVDRMRSEEDLEDMEQRHQEAQDRLTIRAGIIVLPLIIAFVYFMTQL